MSAETLRRAAALMRERAEAAARPWHGWGDTSLPERSGVEAWKADMDGYLGGDWGEYAASWHPAVALAVADWLEAEAEAVDGLASSLSDYALAVARAYLGES